MLQFFDLFSFVCAADFEAYTDYPATNYESIKLFADIGGSDFVGIDPFK